ncbi:hypothetical protein BDB00DRAFT_816474 [Zychaea mexicana]|uniref:uncharacterized protein n=1 Tax=Zychaea mexicana TaxID=64656 RepID=UPI0022FDE963|nr:uncharacterized protein BDB00DRAFT_816474 [Zychaea mexicana]KAI9494967.1 hypothetical protein BDB00DRAFT_816474 [Zychaea mexicana]
MQSITRPTTPSVVVTPPDLDTPNNVVVSVITANNKSDNTRVTSDDDDMDDDSTVAKSVSTVVVVKTDPARRPSSKNNNNNNTSAAAASSSSSSNNNNNNNSSSSSSSNDSTTAATVSFRYPSNTAFTTTNNTRKAIPQFFFPHGKPIASEERDRKNRKIMAIVRHLYGAQSCLLESHFVAITRTCGLPRYMNIALFRRIDSMHQRDERITLEQFAHGWTELSRDRYDDESLFFNILRKPGCAWLLPEDFLPVMEDIVLHHPGLRFLADNPMFQERYIETVICRLYYEARCPSGKMTLAQFRRSDFAHMIHTLGPNVDLNSTRDCFSYKHFYVLYCKFWSLDDDHDLIISEANLAKYNQAALTPRVVHRIMQCGRIAAFARDQSGGAVWGDAPTLTYLDYIWFLLSEVDKSTPMAIEYWFRCMDTDGDGVLSSYELAQFWQEQEARQRFYGVADDDQIQFQNILCQMNDLIQPQVPGQFRLHDLKRNGYLAERFFDTFCNFDRFQIHESYQGSIRAKRKQEQDKRRQQQHLMETGNGSDAAASCSSVVEDEIAVLDDSLGYFMISDWCEYAEAEYQQLLLSERNDVVWDDDDDDDDDDEDEDEEEEDVGYLGEEDDEDEEAVVSSEEESLSPAVAAIAAVVMSTVSEAEKERIVSKAVVHDEGDEGNKDEEEEDDDDAVNPGESSGTSDHDSDTSAPTTPTKDPTPAPPSWSTAVANTTTATTTAATTEAVVHVKHNDVHRHHHQPWLWQPHGEDEHDDDEEEEREDRAAEWIWWLSRQRLSEPSS